MPQTGKKNYVHRRDIFERGTRRLPINQFFASIRPAELEEALPCLTTLDEDCPICTEPVIEGTQFNNPKGTHTAVKAPCCRGIFGSSCLWQWLDGNEDATCPRCRGSSEGLFELFDSHKFRDFKLWINHETHWSVDELQWRVDANEWFPIPKARLFHEIDIVKWFLAPRYTPDGQELDDEETADIWERAGVLVGLLDTNLSSPFLDKVEEEIAKVEEDLQCITGISGIEKNRGRAEIIEHFNYLARKLAAPIRSEGPGAHRHWRYWTNEELEYRIDHCSESPIEISRWEAEINAVVKGIEHFKYIYGEDLADLQIREYENLQNRAFQLSRALDNRACFPNFPAERPNDDERGEASKKKKKGKKHSKQVLEKNLDKERRSLGFQELCGWKLRLNRLLGDEKSNYGRL